MVVDKERFVGLKSYLEQNPIEGYCLTEDSPKSMPYRIGKLSFENADLEFLNIPRFDDTELMVEIPPTVTLHELKEMCNEKGIKARVWGDKHIGLNISVSLKGQLSNKEIKEIIEKLLQINDFVKK